MSNIEHEAVIKNAKKETTIRITGLVNGIVIDRMGAGESLMYVDMLKINKGDPVFIAMYVDSKKRGIKDLMKMANRDLTKNDEDRIAIVAYLTGNIPTITKIKNGVKISKFEPVLPDEILEVIRCNNPICISSKEPSTPTRFDTLSPKPLKVRCQYCERSMKEHEITLLKT